jgi:sporulation protein YlmC with PRC-barrel domain
MTIRNIVKASEVTGVNVKNAAGESLGKINEVVIDKNLGKVSYLVLEFGGILNFGNKFFAIPWKLFTYNEHDDCFMLNVDKDKLKNAPGFDKDHWSNFTAQETTTAIEQFYN